MSDPPIKPPGGLRVDIRDLAPRKGPSTDPELDQTLKRLGGVEGTRCERDCDCAIGLVCRDGVCTGDW